MFPRGGEPIATPLTIGVFDSGIGGFSVLRHLLRRLPGARFLYHGDIARMPYGDHPLADILAFGLAVDQWLEAEGCSASAIACNTTSAAILGQPSPFRLPAYDVITPLAGWIQGTAHARIGVVTTPASARRLAHAQVLSEARPECEVITTPARQLARLVETGADDSALLEEIGAALEPIQAAGCTAVVLGCTHYPLALAHFRTLLGEGVELVDTGDLVATAIAARFPEATTGTSNLAHRFVTSAPSDIFTAQLARLMPPSARYAHQIEDVIAPALAPAAG